MFTVVAGHFFGDADHHVEGSGGHAEAGADASDMPGVSAFSPTVIAIFITSFGAFGLILTRFEATRSPFVSAPLSVAGGVLVAGVVLGLLRQLFMRTQGSSESKVSSVVGMTASVITPIPEHGVGEIAYVQAGTRYTAPAREEKGRPVGNGQAVRVTRVVGTQFYVEPA
jgi:membrane protein implicated in regulation of membrane protease activity